MRNDPCPCGSGKKYKKCHGAAIPLALQQANDTRREEFRRAALAKAADMQLHTALLAYGEHALPADWLDEALYEYTGVDAHSEEAEEVDVTDAEENIWIAWSLHHRVNGDGKTVAELFLAHQERSRRGMLSALDRDVLNAHRAAPLTLWKVVTIEYGIGTQLEDLLSGRRVFAYDAASTESLQPNLVLLAYVLDVNGVHFFGGVHQAPLPPMIGHALKERVAAHLGEQPPLSASALRPAWQMDLCAFYGDAVVEMHEQVLPRTITNNDGHVLAPTVDHFQLRVTLPTLRKALAGIPRLSLEERSRGQDRWTLLDTDPAPSVEPPSGFGPSLLAELLLTKDTLLVTTNSVERADRVRQLLESAVGARVEFVDRLSTPPEEVMERMQAMMAEHQARMSAPPAATANRDGIFLTPDVDHEEEMPEEVRVAIGARMQAESRRWLELSIPALGGLTPRQAIRDEAMRPQLIALLDDMAWRSRGLAGWKTMDVALIRRELGIS